MGILRGFVTFLIFFMFAASGTMKLTDKINPDIHQLMKTEFVRFAKVHPCTVLFNYTIEPDLYRVVIGWVEVVCAALLLVAPAPLKVLTNLLLMVIMIGAVYTVSMVGDPPDKLIPASVTFVLLCVHLFLMHRKEEAPKKETKTD